MTSHAKDTLRGSCISKVFDLAFAISASEASCAKCLVSREDCYIFNFVPASIAAVGAVVADEGAVTEEQEVGVGVEKSAACVAAEAIEVPAVASCW